MRKSLIAQSAAAMIAGLGLAAANAAVVGPATGTIVNTVPEANRLVVNTDYIGHINLVPYYSTAAGNDTYINITNTDTKNGKAVKLRFRGASNSDDVYDITVLMSPGDMFAAAITRDVTTGLPRLTHNDNSCTIPGPADVKRTFVPDRLDQSVSAAERAAQASEGYVEILNMADIPYNSSTTSLYFAIKHNAAGVAPCTAAPINALLIDSTDYANAQTKGLEVPTTGLMTNWTVINVPKAASYTGAAVAVEARQALPSNLPGWGNIVLFPQTSIPIAQATVNNLTADPLFRSADVTGGPALLPVIEAASFDFPDLSTPYTVNVTGATGPLAQASALTAALAVTSTTNEFVTSPSIAAKTGWVFSMPTRRYNVAFNYDGTTNAERRVFSNLAAAGAPAVNYFTADNTTVSGRQLCVGGIKTVESVTPSTITEGPNRTAAVTSNREEGFLQSQSQAVVSPGTPTAPLTFCGEVTVLGFNTTNPLGASVTLRGIESALLDGWMRISHPGLGATATTGAGLPIIGNMMTEIVNGAVAAGTAGNFGQTFPHRHTRP